MSAIAQLDYLWERVRQDPSKLEETIRDVLHIADISPQGARNMLTGDIRPSDPSGDAWENKSEGGITVNPLGNDKNAVHMVPAPTGPRIRTILDRPNN